MPDTHVQGRNSQCCRRLSAWSSTPLSLRQNLLVPRQLDLSSLDEILEFPCHGPELTHTGTCVLRVERTGSGLRQAVPRPAHDRKAIDVSTHHPKAERTSTKILWVLEPGRVITEAPSASRAAAEAIDCRHVYGALTMPEARSAGGAKERSRTSQSRGAPATTLVPLGGGLVENFSELLLDCPRPRHTRGCSALTDYNCSTSRFEMHVTHTAPPRLKLRAYAWTPIWQKALGILLRIRAFSWLLAPSCRWTGGEKELIPQGQCYHTCARSLQGAHTHATRGCEVVPSRCVT